MQEQSEEQLSACTVSRGMEQTDDSHLGSWQTWYNYCVIQQVKIFLLSFSYTCYDPFHICAILIGDISNMHLVSLGKCMLEMWNKVYDPCVVAFACQSCLKLKYYTIRIYWTLSNSNESKDLVNLS